MVILWDNKIDDALLTASSEIIKKEVDNIKDPTLSEYFSFDGNSGNVVMDLLSSINIKDIIIAGTNITSSYTTIKIEANNSDDWSTPLYSKNLELYPNSYLGLKNINESYRYWRIVLSDSNIDDIHLGYVYIGGRLQMPGIDPAVKLNYNQSTTRSLSVSRQLYSDTGVDYFSSGFTFPIIKEDPFLIGDIVIASREDILEMWGYNKGATPLILIIWDNNRIKFPPIVGVITEDSLDFEMNERETSYSLSFNFEETK